MKLNKENSVEEENSRNQRIIEKANLKVDFDQHKMIEDIVNSDGLTESYEFFTRNKDNSSKSNYLIHSIQQSDTDQINYNHQFGNKNQIDFESKTTSQNFLSKFVKKQKRSKTQSRERFLIPVNNHKTPNIKEFHLVNEASKTESKQPIILTTNENSVTTSFNNNFKENKGFNNNVQQLENIINSRYNDESQKPFRIETQPSHFLFFKEKKEQSILLRSHQLEAKDLIKSMDKNIYYKINSHLPDDRKAYYSKKNLPELVGYFNTYSVDKEKIMNHMHTDNGKIDLSDTFYLILKKHSINKFYSGEKYKDHNQSIKLNSNEFEDKIPIDEIAKSKSSSLKHLTSVRKIETETDLKKSQQLLIPLNYEIKHNEFSINRDDNKKSSQYALERNSLNILNDPSESKIIKRDLKKNVLKSKIVRYNDNENDDMDQHNMTIPQDENKSHSFLKKNRRINNDTDDNIVPNVEKMNENENYNEGTTQNIENKIPIRDSDMRAVNHNLNNINEKVEVSSKLNEHENMNDSGFNEIKDIHNKKLELKIKRVSRAIENEDKYTTYESSSNQMLDKNLKAHIKKKNNNNNIENQNGIEEKKLNSEEDFMTDPKELENEKNSLNPIEDQKSIPNNFYNKEKTKTSNENQITFMDGDKVDDKSLNFIPTINSNEEKILNNCSHQIKKPQKIENEEKNINYFENQINNPEEGDNLNKTLNSIYPINPQEKDNEEETLNSNIEQFINPKKVDNNEKNMNFNENQITNPNDGDNIGKLITTKYTINPQEVEIEEEISNSSTHQVNNPNIADNKEENIISNENKITNPDADSVDKSINSNQKNNPKETDNKGRTLNSNVVQLINPKRVYNNEKNEENLTDPSNVDNEDNSKVGIEETIKNSNDFLKANPLDANELTANCNEGSKINSKKIKKTLLNSIDDYITPSKEGGNEEKKKNSNEDYRINTKELDKEKILNSKGNRSSNAKNLSEQEKTMNSNELKNSNDLKNEENTKSSNEDIINPNELYEVKTLNSSECQLMNPKDLNYKENTTNNNTNYKIEPEELDEETSLNFNENNKTNSKNIDSTEITQNFKENKSINPKELAYREMTRSINIPKELDDTDKLLNSNKGHLHNPKEIDYTEKSFNNITQNITCRRGYDKEILNSNEYPRNAEIPDYGISVNDMPLKTNLHTILSEGCDNKNLKNFGNKECRLTKEYSSLPNNYNLNNLLDGKTGIDFNNKKTNKNNTVYRNSLTEGSNCNVENVENEGKKQFPPLKKTSKITKVINLENKNSHDQVDKNKQLFMKKPQVKEMKIEEEAQNFIPNSVKENLMKKQNIPNNILSNPNEIPKEKDKQLLQDIKLFKPFQNDILNKKSNNNSITIYNSNSRIANNYLEKNDNNLSSFDNITSNMSSIIKDKNSDCFFQNNNKSKQNLNQASNYFRRIDEFDKAKSKVENTHTNSRKLLNQILYDYNTKKNKDNTKSDEDNNHKVPINEQDNDKSNKNIEHIVDNFENNRTDNNRKRFETLQDEIETLNRKQTNPINENTKLRIDNCGNKLSTIFNNMTISNREESSKQRPSITLNNSTLQKNKVKIMGKNNPPDTFPYRFINNDKVSQNSIEDRRSENLLSSNNNKNSKKNFKKNDQINQKNIKKPLTHPDEAKKLLLTGDYNRKNNNENVINYNNPPRANLQNHYIPNSKYRSIVYPSNDIDYLETKYKNMANSQIYSHLNQFK